MEQTLVKFLEQLFKPYFIEAGLDPDSPIQVVPASKPEFGDYQVNGLMQASKKASKNPREVAAQIIDKFKDQDRKYFSKLEIAGPGFINLVFSDEFLSNWVNHINGSNHFGLLNYAKQKVVVDLSSPNLSKEMHVGHLRSTIIGDVVGRALEYTGNEVILQNHVGDWGTQFGMLIAYLEETHALDNDKQFKINDLETFYRSAKERFDQDADFANKARSYVVVLQNWQEHGDAGKKVYQHWQSFCELSLSHCQEIYDQLKVKLTKQSVVGESFYNDKLKGIVKTLEHKNLLVESDNAKCVFFAEGELAGKEETPFIIQKSDGGFLYATTDLAAIDYRVHKLEAKRIIYVVDARQSLHFKQLFIVAKKAGFANSDTLLEHSAFGTMMNEEGRPFKTREGGVVKLIDLINEAKLRAHQVVSKRNPQWSKQEVTELADILAIAAIKYADLSKNRLSDYIFSFDKMLSFEGNTAPYLLYAYTRIQSILKKADSMLDRSKLEISITHPNEHKLALQNAKFAEVLLEVNRENAPHYLCQYLYNLAGVFMQFYENCPILNVDNDQVKSSRLALANQSGAILKAGLDILGIEVVKKM